MGKEEIVEGIRAGNNKVISHIYSEYKPMLIKFITRQGIKDYYIAESLAIDTLSTFWEKCKMNKEFSVNEDTKVSTYLCSIARNLSLKYFSNKKNSYESLEESVNVIDKSAIHKIEEFTHKEFAFQTAVAYLPESNRMLLNLIIDGFSGNEIAEKMGFKNSDVVKTKKIKIKYAIKKKLHELNFKEMFN